MRFLTWLLTHAAALAVATWLLEGIRFAGPRSGIAEVQEKLLPLLLVALILGVVTAVVKPVVTFLSIPFIVVTLGLFLLVVNAAMLLLTGWIADRAGLGFTVDGFWTAVLGAVVLTLTTWAVDGLLGERRRG